MDNRKAKNILSEAKREIASEEEDELSPPSLGRNDICLCGSGLKYKKCCLAKNRAPVYSGIRLESFEIKSDPLTPEESKEDYGVLFPKDKELMSTLFHNLNEHPETIDSEDCEYFQKLNMLRDRYPNNPIILNYITNGYDLLGQQDQVEKLIAETYEKFPDYLFAQTAQANIYLKKGFPEKAFEVLKGANTLIQLYPHRTVFHITELRAFEYTMVWYFCEIKNFEQADIHLQVMRKILEADDAIFLKSKILLKKSKILSTLQRNISRIFGKSNDRK